MLIRSVVYVAFLSVLVLAFACGSGDTRFELLSPGKTGIDFVNAIQESDTFNVLRFEYLYNGGGVGVADVNNDGLQDIFFAGNMVSSRLYLNRGDFKFADVTEAANVKTNLWCTGVAMVDVNNDGLVDIHVATIHPDRKKSSRNLFFLNRGSDKNGTPVFEEVAARAGIADQSYSTQSAFFDFDLDGDLDMYLLNNALEDFNRNTAYGQRHDGGGKSMDKLFRNDGNSLDGIPQFSDVSREAGILSEGWGLGIVVNDFNNDQYPDIYVANDFLSNDFIYINNRNGTFTNQVAKYLKHQEHNGMGVDMADINNDGLNDIVVMDMMPDDNLRQKTMFANTGYDRFHLNLRRKYQTQYVRNVLQLNNGNGTFSDIGYMSGIYATDWSWSTLMADFDNDGFRDILITNGYRKDVTDLDFVAYSQESSIFGTDETRIKNAVAAVNELPGVLKPNFIYHNNGDLTFANKAKEWGMDQPSYSNGAAYADFDNDGDLDVVMNNINDNAFLYRNNSKDSESNYLRFVMKGNGSNSHGLGAKIYLYHAGGIQYAEHQLQRGYKSNVENIEHFGLGSLEQIDSVVILWPRGGRQVLKKVKTNSTITFREDEARGTGPAVAADLPKPLVREVTDEYGIKYSHREKEFVDFKSQALLPHKHSQAGPGLAVGDINNDGLEDFVAGAAAGMPAVLFIQQRDGRFKTDTLSGKANEDMGILLFDADGDNDLDLYCVSGSSEFNIGGAQYQDRFYRNAGNARFELDAKALPLMNSSGSCVNAADFDQDGDLDLFVGGRISPGRYPETPESYLLINNGAGVFTDASEKLAPGIKTIGMVTSALWTDVDNDQWMDLLVTGEWMPIVLFKNQNGILKRDTPGQMAGTLHGWWNSITGADIDRDGDVDYIAGNLGLNSIYKASAEQPVSLYAKDFDSNGSIDPVLTRFIGDTEFITHPRETLTDQVVALRRELQRYSIYGKKTFHDIFPSNSLKDATILRATHFASSILENTGKGQFTVTPLPVRAQVSPVYGVITDDLNGDGLNEIIMIGNSYATETLTGWYDAGAGASFSLRPGQPLEYIPNALSGFTVDGDAKALVRLNSVHGDLLIASQNNDSIRAFINAARKNEFVFVPSALDTHADMLFRNGRKQRVEFYYGSGYLSQSSRSVRIPDSVNEVTVYNSTGEARQLNLSQFARKN